MFKSAGKYRAKLKEVEFAESIFKDVPPNTVDVCLRFETEDGQSDWWRGELSGRYGVGNAANKTQQEMTLSALRGIGFEGDDLTALENLIGIETDITVDSYVNKDGKTFYNIKYISDTFRPKAIAKSELMKRLPNLFGSAPHDAAEPEPAEKTGW